MSNLPIDIHDITEKISGCSIIEQVDTENGSISYRAQKDTYKKPIVIKVINSEYFSPSSIAKFKQEYQTIKSIDFDGVVKTYDVIDDKNNIALLLEDFNGLPLKDLIKNGNVDNVAFLQLAISLSGIIGNLHEKKIVHKDIKLRHILFNKTSEQIKLTGFGALAELTSRYKEIYDVDIIKNRLPYISPEQTGRMNRNVDYRTDLYSLGIVFYELLTGHAPFLSNDPLEIIHAHIAKQPVAPFKIYKTIPEPISDIVMKLLAKTAEDRYQNSFGLKSDLQKCLKQIISKGKIKPFELAQKDIPPGFQIPKKLYGREKELEVLLAGFDRAGQGEKKTILVSGYPGIGKTSLINEIQKAIVPKKAYFMSGKYHQFRPNAPYEAIIQAFQGLLKQILFESAERTSTWKEDLSKALGLNGKVITDVIPDVELITGVQPDVPNLGPKETQNRFNLVFENFIKVFAKPDHPLVFWLDDLQWADSASFEFITNLATNSDAGFLLLIFSYRDNEMPKSHKLISTVKDIIKTDVNVDDMKLPLLDIHHVSDLIADCLKCDKERSFSLAGIVHTKTAGNPFFVNQFMETLHKKGLLELDGIKGWQWNINSIDRMRVTDNVLDLMVGKIADMPKEAVETLTVCACIGNRFDLETLAVTLDKPIELALAGLVEPISEGLVDISGDEYMFHHNRIQEAAYALIPEEEKAKLHHSIGKAALEKTHDEDLPEIIFDIVNQLNFGATLAVSGKERYELVKFNLMAGTKARGSAAYKEAQQFLEQAVSVLPADAWEEEYDLTLALYSEGAELGFLLGNHKQAEKYFDEVVEKAKKELDKVRVYEVKIDNYMVSYKPKEALKLGKEALKMLGVTMPHKTDPKVIRKEFAMTNAFIKERKIEDLIDLNEIKDPYDLAIMSILTSCLAPCYIGDPDYLPFITLKALNLTLTHGNSRYAPLFYAAHAGSLISAFGDIEQGYEFGNLALAVVEKFDARESRTKTYYAFPGFINHWKRPIRENFKYLLEAYKSVSETGDLVFASFALTNYIMISFWSGQNLDSVKESYAKYFEVMEKFNQLRSIELYRLGYQLVANLSGETEDRLLLKGEVFDEKEIVPKWVKANELTSLGFYTVNKLFLSYFYKDFGSAVKFAKQGEKYLSALEGMIVIAEYYFYYSLALLAHYPRVKGKTRGMYLDHVKENQKKMKKWAKHCPENFENKYLLVEAERSVFQGNTQKAIELYDRAIYLAEKNGFLHEGAIANERAAIFCRGNRMGNFAGVYVKNAINGFKRWGALIKFEDLEKEHPEILEQSSKVRTDTSNMELDYTSVINSLQVISTEIIIDDLLKKLLAIVMENAGAQRSLFLSVKKNCLFVEAETTIEHDEVSIIKSVNVDKRNDLSFSVVNYVLRTKKQVVLDDAGRKGDFVSDAYVLSKHPKSILCLPVIRQSSLVGILYLENNIASGAFTENRVEVLKLMASQAAISIENALLYDNVIQKEKALQESEEKFRLLTEEQRDVVLKISLDEKIEYFSPAIKDFGGYNPDQEVGSPLSKYLVNKNDIPNAQIIMNRFFNKKEVSIFEFLFKPKNKEPFFVELTGKPIINQNKVVAVQCVMRDISERKKSEDALKEREKELELKTESLEEVNAALRVLLARRDKDKLDLEENVLFNVNDLVNPYITKLKQCNLNDRQSTLINILADNLDRVVSPFVRRISSKYYSLTPKEIEIINFIKQGKTVKEIADVLCLSTRTIETHRNNIRSKLGIKNKKVNLTTYLLSIK